MYRPGRLWFLVVAVMGGLFMLYIYTRQSLPLRYLYIEDQTDLHRLSGNAGALDIPQSHLNQHGTLNFSNSFKNIQYGGGSNSSLNLMASTANQQRGDFVNGTNSESTHVTDQIKQVTAEQKSSPNDDRELAKSSDETNANALTLSIAPACKNIVKNIYYVKVHKTGSSTMITVLYGAARRHDLTVFPVSRDPYPGAMNNSPFKKPKEYQDMVYNIFAEHAIFKADIADRLMPEDTRYIATMREPLAQLRSSFVEFGVRLRDSHGRRLKSTESAELFLNNPTQYGR